MEFQKEIWASKFGEDYTNRNICNPSELNKFYQVQYGITREEMNKEFLEENVNKNAKILEVGCNVGNQLRMLQSMGYNNLYGIELQDYAVEKGKQLTRKINIIKGLGDDIPFKDGYFDLVFTSGVLIHIPPELLNNVMSEIYRCTKNYIWGFEYFSKGNEEINYRGNENLLWKNNFANIYLDLFKELRLIKEKKYKYIENDNIDSMFILSK